ncbi:DUF2783 domain-containing protein [Rhodobaculum claviforme]|uniref:DUF2783 domain-containing protein n=1 Tax=Rhodobaculum claviforme TaxID=1549854 RepID=A0A934WI60_9RHOB|nr:DUF2783 domain-containing protein [Rhodobaculum claviforme]MBK5927870.1 DUF2783 domain-containing protein [Rhodobaculum claviforme]
MSRIATALTIADPEGFYAELLAVHDALSPEASAALNARLILLLANQVGDRAVLSEALQEAARGSDTAG